MKKVAIKVKNYTPNVNIVNNNNLQIRIFHVLVIALGTLALCYVFVLGSTVFNIVERQTLGVVSKTLSNEVGDLELKYLALSNKIDKTLSVQMGFKETKAQFAIRKTSLTALNYNANEL